MYKSLNKIVSIFVEKLLKFRIMFKDILTFLGLKTLYFVVLGISIPNIISIG